MLNLLKHENDDLFKYAQYVHSRNGVYRTNYIGIKCEKLNLPLFPSSQSHNYYRIFCGHISSLHEDRVIYWDLGYLLLP